MSRPMKLKLDVSPVPPTDLATMEEKAREIGRIIGGMLPKDIGFTFQLFTFGEGGWATYISNCDRQDMIRALKELIARLESKKP